MASLTGNWSLKRFMIPRSMRIIALSFPINRLEFENVVCVVSNRACRRSDFQMSTRLSTILSIWDDITFQLAIIES